MKTIAPRLLLAGLLAVLAPCAPAGAQDLDTLKRIKSTGTIITGHRDGSVPFSYFDHIYLPVGYSIDICLRIVDAIKVSLDMPKIDARMRLITTAARVPSVANGTIDMECGSTTNTIERQQQLAFVVTTFVAATRLAVKKASNIKGLDDLMSKLAVAAAGTTNLRQITEVNSQRGLHMTIAPVKSTGDGFSMLEKGDAVAFASDDTLLYGMIANAAASDTFEVTREALSVEPYEIMVRRDDPAFKKVADDAVRALFASGEIEKIYATWFTAQIAPKNIALNAPMSDALKRAIAKPTDSGNPSDN